MTEMERAGWRRDDAADMWVHGNQRIYDEVIVGFGRNRVQAYAMRVTGDPLPNEAFPAPAEIAATQPVLDSLIKGLTSGHVADRSSGTDMP